MDKDEQNTKALNTAHDASNIFKPFLVTTPLSSVPSANCVGPGYAGSSCQAVSIHTAASKCVGVFSEHGQQAMHRRAFENITIHTLKL